MTAFGRRFAAVGAGLALVTLLAGCLPGSNPSPAQPSAAASPSGEVIRVSQTPGEGIDRPHLPPSGAKPDGFVDAPLGDGLTGYLKQSIEWRECAFGECGSIVAPLDYANPAKQAITLALARKSATRHPRLGTLFVNPGGPGASGRELVGYFNSKGLDQYDIVGWDPRGTNHSTPVSCFDGADADRLNALDASPDDPAETEVLIRGAYEFGKSCWERSGALLEHISTVDTVRDLDLMRALVGDRRLNYLGYSYGTRIGAVYAELFPGRAGRLVLDAAVDITDDDSVIQAMGFDLALGNFASWCGRGGCGLGGSKRAVLKTITDLLDRLDRAPVKVGDRELTQSLAATGIATYLYGGIPAWQELAGGLKSALRGDGKALLDSADALNNRESDGSYGSLFYSFPAIGCVDGKDKGVVEAEQRWASDQRKAPIFGQYFGVGYTCALWPVRTSQQFKPTGSGAPPILVIGATGDPATPYQNAVTMARQLKSGVLVTYQGEGHGTFGGKSACVDRLVIRYLTRGKVPPDGVKCR